MASYLTGSEAFTREKLPTESSTSTSNAGPQAAWADKYRGVRRPSHPIEPKTQLT
jgi:hypothetical protein